MIRPEILSNCQIPVALRAVDFLALLGGGSNMLVGYARLSTADQNLDLQRHAKQRAGCAKICSGQYGRASAERLGLQAPFDVLPVRDPLTIWRLDP